MQRDPAKRWRLIQEMITWAEANMKAEHRSTGATGHASRIRNNRLHRL